MLSRGCRDSRILVVVDTTWQSGGLTQCADASAGEWIVGSVRPFAAYAAGCLVPPTFAAYARLFHPAQRDDGVDVRWSEVAAANGAISHPAMQWASITGERRFLYEGGQPGIWDDPPRTGSLPGHQVRRLSQLLATQTATASRCWFAVWEGYGGLAVPRGATVCRMEMPQRPMLVFGGGLADAATSFEDDPFGQTASLWWPADRSWCVAGDVDLTSTFVGGSRACIDLVLGDRRLEAMEIGIDLSLLWDSDLLNPSPAADPG